MDRQEVVSSLGGVSLSQHLTHTFLWMTAGLAVTAIVAFLTLFSGLWITIYSFSLAPLVLLVAQLGVVIFLTGKLAKMQPSTAKLLFLCVFGADRYYVLNSAAGLWLRHDVYRFWVHRADVWKHGRHRHDHKERFKRSGPDSDGRTDHDDRHHDRRRLYRSGRHFDGDELYHDRNFPGA